MVAQRRDATTKPNCRPGKGGVSTTCRPRETKLVTLRWPSLAGDSRRCRVGINRKRADAEAVSRQPSDRPADPDLLNPTDR